MKVDNVTVNLIIAFTRLNLVNQVASGNSSFSYKVKHKTTHLKEISILIYFGLIMLLTLEFTISVFPSSLKL